MLLFIWLNTIHKVTLTDTKISDSSKIDPASVEVSTPESGIYDTTRLWSALTRQRFSLTWSEVLRRPFPVGRAIGFIGNPISSKDLDHILGGADEWSYIKRHMNGAGN